MMWYAIVSACEKYCWFFFFRNCVDSHLTFSVLFQAYMSNFFLVPVRHICWFAAFLFCKFSSGLLVSQNVGSENLESLYFPILWKTNEENSSFYHSDGPEGHEAVAAVGVAPGIPARILSLLQDEHLPTEVSLLKGNKAGERGTPWTGLGGGGKRVKWGGTGEELEER